MSGSFKLDAHEQIHCRRGEQSFTKHGLLVFKLPISGCLSAASPNHRDKLAEDTLQVRSAPKSTWGIKTAAVLCWHLLARLKSTTLCLHLTVPHSGTSGCCFIPQVSPCKACRHWQRFSLGPDRVRRYHDCARSDMHAGSTMIPVATCSTRSQNGPTCLRRINVACWVFLSWAPMGIFHGSSVLYRPSLCFSFSSMTPSDSPFEVISSISPTLIYLTIPSNCFPATFPSFLPVTPTQVFHRVPSKPSFLPYLLHFTTSILEEFRPLETPDHPLQSCYLLQ